MCSDATLCNFIIRHAYESLFAAACVKVPFLFFGALISDECKVSIAVPYSISDPRHLYKLRFWKYVVKGQWDWNRLSDTGFKQKVENFLKEVMDIKK